MHSTKTLIQKEKRKHHLGCSYTKRSLFSNCLPLVQLSSHSDMVLIPCWNLWILSSHMVYGVSRNKLENLIIDAINVLSTVMKYMTLDVECSLFCSTSLKF